MSKFQQERQEKGMGEVVMTDKMKMHSRNKAEENYLLLARTFPNAVTETIVGYDENNKPIIERAIDADVLRQEIAAQVVEGREERYQFTWPDKKKAVLEANTPIEKTLRPCREESVDFDRTENLYIEGDNLEVLKLLQETYLGKIKMIYIDPPYNTGNDFIYHDNFNMDSENYSEISGQYDEQGNRMVQNVESNGRFHTDWLNMMYPRLKLARDLLSDDGVLFMSIDDNEVENLKKIGNEIFGDSNFVDILKWKKKKQPSFLAKHTAKVMEYVFIYAKNKEILEKLSIEGTSDSTKKVINISNPESLRLFQKGVRVKGEPNQTIAAGRYTIKTMEVEYLSDVIVVDGKTQNDVEVKARFSVSQEKINGFIQEELLFITAQKGLRRDVSKEEVGKRKSITDLLLSEWGDNQESDKEFLDLFSKKYFDYTKPVNLVKNLLKSNYTEDQIVLDFFSGSATTAHAVMQLNAEDNGRRKYIMVQIPEATDKDSDANQDGYHTICEIGKERIRRAGKKIAENSTIDGLDIGFRVLKLGSSNMKDVYYMPVEYQQTLFETATDNIKSDRTPEDLLFQVMLDLGVLLSSEIETVKLAGKDVFCVEDNYLIACFDENVTEETVKEIAQRQPYYAVFRDSSFANDSVAANFEQIFETYSPTTVRKVL